VKKVTGSAATYFVYDESAHLIGEYDTSGALIEETVWMGEIPVAVLKPNGGGGVDLFYLHTDHLNTPRRMSRPGDNVIVWRWDSDPFGTTAANEDPDGDTTPFVYNPRFPGQYYDSESGLNYNYFRDYDAVTGRYAESDPIGLAGGINTYGYAQSSPLKWVDLLGLDIAVIENGPTSGNPIGHTAIAVSGAGVYSFGNTFDLGKSMARYLSKESARRDTTVYIIKTTGAQDAAILEYLRSYKDYRLPTDKVHALYLDNCSTRANRALDAAGIPRWAVVDPLSGAETTNMPGTAGMRAQGVGAEKYYVPRNASSLPLVFQLFEPRN